MEYRENTTRDLGSVWRFAVADTKNGGVSPFPFPLAERLMLLSTVTGDRVLDPFAGTPSELSRNSGDRAKAIASKDHQHSFKSAMRNRDLRLIEVVV
jgi:hypothetical protein